MDVIQQTIKEFEELTGVSADKFNLDFVCGFMECRRLMNLSILKLDPTPAQLERFKNEWLKVTKKV